MTRTLTGALCAGVIAAFIPAYASALVDHNGDGRISRAEYRTIVAAISERADADKDGRISADEFPFTPADLALFDNDGDGQVTSVDVQEFRDGMDLAFDAMDTDMDDYLSAAELTAAGGRYGIAAPTALLPDQAASAKPRPFSKG